MRTPGASAIVFAVVAVFSLLGGVVSAHHSRAGYDTDDKITTLKGTVTEFQWRNPHVFLVWAGKDDKGSHVNCDPKGWPRLHTYNYGFEFVMLPDRVLQFFELTHTWRTIWTDGRKLPDNPPQPNWTGWNVGHWDGDTFIVESNGFEERSWLSDTRPDGGWTHSDELRVVERWRRLNYGTLEAQITVIDPKTYTQPWVTPAAKISLVPGAELWENFCVPSDYNTFNNDVFLPVAGEVKK